jgi:hypothetical protein
VKISSKVERRPVDLISLCIFHLRQKSRLTIINIIGNCEPSYASIAAVFLNLPAKDGGACSAPHSGAVEIAFDINWVGSSMGSRRVLEAVPGIEP